MITLARVFMTGIRNFVRNSWLTIAATAVMVVAITISLIAIVLNVTAKNAITELSKNLQISVYLYDDINQEDRLKLQSAIVTNQYVANVEYVDKNLALQRFSDNFGDDQGVIEGLALVGSESLPASLEISVSDLDKIEEVGAIPQSPEYSQIVESVSLGRTDAQKTIDRASSAQRFIIRASVITAAIFSGVSVLIIFNTIRMAIFTRSEEIRIMKLIGATPAFIRGPFLVEASLYGIIAGLLAVGATYAFVVSIGSKIASQPEFFETYRFFTQTSTFVYMLVGSVLGGVLVGVVSSMLAMERYLKLKDW